MNKEINNVKTKKRTSGLDDIEDFDSPSTSIKRVNFTAPGLCSGSAPVSCRIDGNDYQVDGSWGDLFITLIEHFMIEFPVHFKRLFTRGLLPGSHRPFFLRKKPKGSARKLSNGYWVYINYSIQSLVNLIGKLCEFSEINLNNVAIFYVSKELKTGHINVAVNKKQITLTSRETKTEPTQRVFDTGFWDDNVKLKFRQWLRSKTYAQRTIENYCCAITRIFKSFSALFQKALTNSDNESETIRKYIELLKKNKKFVEINHTRHNQLTAALVALECFYTLTIQNSNAETFVKKQFEIVEQSSLLHDIVDLEDGKEKIRIILESHFRALYGYSNSIILWNTAKNTLPMFLNDNAINSEKDLWQLILKIFSDDYVMNRPHIWQKKTDYSSSKTGIIVNVARQEGGIISKEQIDEYFNCIKLPCPTNNDIILQKLLMFYDKKRFILSEVVNLTDERCDVITDLLNKLFEQEGVPYIILRDISKSWFLSLPVLGNGIFWTVLLLQEVLRSQPSIGYRIISSGIAGQTYDTLGAAIVLSKSDIISFADVVHCYCLENDLTGKKMKTEYFRIILRKAGMLEGNELIYNLHKALKDYRFAFTDENKMIKILER